MNKAQWKELVEAVLYILNATKGLDYYRVFKVLYFAQKEHLKRYGLRMVTEDFVALPYGPVPTHLYEAIRQGTLHADIDVVEDYILLPKRHCDMDYLSRSEVECLDFSIRENAHLSFNDLKEKSHDAAWRFSTMGNVMPPDQIALAAGADKKLADYIREQEALSLALT